MNIESRGDCGKAIPYKKKRRSGGPTAGATLHVGRDEKILADPSAIEAPIAFHAHLATAKQIGDCCDHFLGVFGAGAHREDEFAE